MNLEFNQADCIIEIPDLRRPLSSNERRQIAALAAEAVHKKMYTALSLHRLIENNEGKVPVSFVVQLVPAGTVRAIEIEVK